MTNEQYAAIRATFPWRRMKATDPGSKAPVYRLVDKNNNDVPILDLMEVMEMLTGKIAGNSK